MTGRLILFSGKTGHVLQFGNVPDDRETYCSPVVYSTSNGTDIVLFGTGGETHPGALWAIGLMDLYHGLTEKVIMIYADKYKGRKIIITIVQCGAWRAQTVLMKYEHGVFVNINIFD